MSDPFYIERRVNFSFFIYPSEDGMKKYTTHDLQFTCIHNGTHVGAQMENKTLKGGNKCDRGWESNKKYPKLNLVRPI